MKEVAGMVLGWAIVTVTAWLIAFALMSYSLASINPLTWSVEERTIHLVIQLVLIALHSFNVYTRDK